MSRAETFHSLFHKSDSGVSCMALRAHPLSSIYGLHPKHEQWVVDVNTMEVVGRPRFANAWLRRWVRGDRPLAGKSPFAPADGGVLEMLLGKVAECGPRGLLQWPGPGLLFPATKGERVTLLDLTHSSLAGASAGWVLSCSRAPAPSHPRPARVPRAHRLYPSHLYRDYSLILGE